MRIELLAPAEIRGRWGLVVSGVLEIGRICGEPWIPEDIYSRLINAQASLFLFHVDGEQKGFAVVELCADPYIGQFINIWLMHFVGEAEAHRAELVDWLDSMAKAKGCKTIRFQSPRAWKAILRGEFKEKSVLYERIL